MSYERSFGKIIEKKGVLGFSMVNPSSQEFFLLAESLINIYRNPAEYIEIKKRTADPRNTEYYQGDIIGKIHKMNSKDQRMKYDEKTYDQDDLKNKYAKITLTFGSADKSLVLNKKETELLNIVDRHEYIFPWNEFRSFVVAIDAMYTQHTEYTLLRMNGSIFLKRDTSLL